MPHNRINFILRGREGGVDTVQHFPSPA